MVVEYEEDSKKNYIIVDYAKLNYVNKNVFDKTIFANKIYFITEVKHIKLLKLLLKNIFKIKSRGRPPLLKFLDINHSKKIKIETEKQTLNI